MNEEQRFRAKVAPANAAGCWLWTACANAKGYGQFGADGRSVYAHRYAWSLAFGPIPDGLHVLHRCDTPPCMNPSHLFLGTNTDNVADREAKGRCRSAGPRGSGNGNAKLNEAQAVEVFRAAGLQKDIGARYGINQPLVSGIKSRKRWAHATEGLST